MPNIGGGMEDRWLGNGQVIQSREAIPRPAFASALRATADLAEPNPLHFTVELLEPVVVSGNRVILTPATDHTPQPTTGLAQFVVATTLELFLNRCQRAGHAFRHRDPN